MFVHAMQIFLLRPTRHARVTMQPSHMIMIAQNIFERTATEDG